jgi:hypothetical protein
LTSAPLGLSHMRPRGADTNDASRGADRPICRQRIYLRRWIFRARNISSAFQYLFGFGEFGNTTGYIKPILFESESTGEFTIYTVRGIGDGFQVALHSAPQRLPFDIIEGTKLTTNGHYTFSFINARI